MVNFSIVQAKSENKDNRNDSVGKSTCSVSVRVYVQIITPRKKLSVALYLLITLVLKRKSKEGFRSLLGPSLVSERPLSND